ncbi:hypothetical protein BZU93_28175 [Salmonella enterica subsp. enterica]|nr:hypothetical protein [Salmonella enterica subsp. enterica serovar Enteritidis]
MVKAASLLLASCTRFSQNSASNEWFHEQITLTPLRLILYVFRFAAGSRRGGIAGIAARRGEANL